MSTATDTTVNVDSRTNESLRGSVRVTAYLST
jgi:hypothetical protein